MSSKGQLSPDEQQEIDHFRQVLDAIQNYKQDTEIRLRKSRADFKNLPVRHQDVLLKHGFMANLDKLESCAAVNQTVLDQVVSDAANLFENSSRPGPNGVAVNTAERAAAVKVTTEEGQDQGHHRRTPTKLMDKEKVHSTLKQLVRDWSDDGLRERETCYQPILKELEALFPAGQRSAKKVLVPGAGLGRLAFEVARQGYQCQGNEFSLFMLFAASFVLNRCKSKNSHTIHPWIHQFTNNVHPDDATRGVKFPDIDPSLHEESNFSMVAGDFLEVYADPSYRDSQDVVVTCFFIDCAKNILHFIELIHQILKPGGVWINLGPLLYHFADLPNESSIEPSYDIVRNLVMDTGFEFRKEVTDHAAVYCQNPKSMLQYHYKCVFSTCVKKIE